ncbi:hypothetical protein AWB81_06656 [Caballeronia arationis]|nr:hypothetical protein AWB81_06656 [Caballeronia arationis]
MPAICVGLQIASVVLQVTLRMGARARFSELEDDGWRVIYPNAILLALARTQIAP